MPCGQFKYMRSFKPCNDNMPCHYGPLGCWAVPMGRLKKLDLQAKPGPTRNYGSEGAREKAIRRRVGRQQALSAQASRAGARQLGSLGTNSYGPLFGLRKNRPFSKLGRGLGECHGNFSPTKYSANSGDSSQVTYFKRVYGAKNTILYRLGQCCGTSPDYGCQCYPNCTYQPNSNCRSGSH
jgi:hypothetical protein